MDSDSKFGRDMDEWGDKFGKRMDDWGERFGRKMDRWERRQRRRARRYHSPGARLFSGVLFVTVGVVFLLGNMGMLDVDSILRFWPVILIAVGVFKLVEHRDDYSQGSGIFWI